MDDVAPKGYAVDRATIRQRKTGRSVRFELTEVTRQALLTIYERAAVKQAILVSWPASGSVADNAPISSASLPMELMHCKKMATRFRLLATLMEL